MVRRMRTFLLTLLVMSPLAHAKKVEAPPPPSWKCETASEQYSTANTALLAGKFDEALTAFDVVLAKEPQCGQALVGAGRSRLGLGKAAEAVVPLASASTLFADKIDAHVWLGRARVAAGDDDGALAAARLAIALKPASVDAQRIAQDALLHKKDIAEAKKMLETARAASNVVTWFCLEGMIAVAEGDGKKAGEMLVACEGVPDRSVYDALAAQVAKLTPPAPAAPAATP
jgi:tetratricopeptide (TPR) repeat protein